MFPLNMFNPTSPDIGTLSELQPPTLMANNAKIAPGSDSLREACQGGAAEAKASDEALLGAEAGEREREREIYCNQKKLKV